MQRNGHPRNEGAFLDEEDEMMTLKELEIGQSAIITRVGGEGALRQHFLDMGVIPGAEITDQICTDGRSYGISGAWLRIDLCVWMTQRRLMWN